jgi:nitrogen fixation protein NifQ
LELSTKIVKIAAARVDEYDDLLALLLMHKSSDEAESYAHEMVLACFGNDHLWQDMGLPDRNALSDIFRDHFNPLFLKNSSNMKWKKFLYKQFCDMLDVKVCRAPSCSVCQDYDNCFGPEILGTRSM